MFRRRARGAGPASRSRLRVSPSPRARPIARSAASLLALTALLIAGAARATTVRPLSIDALHARADVVVRARIEAREARFVGQRIVTFHDARVEETYAGAPGERVVVGLLGGIVGAVGQRVAGTPELEPGREYVLFLGAPRGFEGARTIIGLWQGVFAVEELSERGQSPIRALRAYSHDAKLGDERAPLDVVVTPAAPR